MGHDLLCYTLWLLAGRWLCVILSWLWPQSRAAMGQLQSPAAKAPKPCAGLPHKPLGDACQHATEPRQHMPCARPPRLTCTRGRRRTIDTQQHFCPDQECPYDGWVGRGTIRANGPPGSTSWRQLQCLSCHGYFQETHGTPSHRQRVPSEMLVWAVGARAEGLGIRAVARVFEVDPNTVLAWLVDVAAHLQAFSQSFLHAVHVNQVQLDELCALLSAVQDTEVTAAEAIQRLSRSPHWVWVAMDPESKLLLTLDVGERTLAMAQCVVHQVTPVIAPDCAPLFLTDGFKEYITALLTHFGQWVQPLRRPAHGPAPKPRWIPYGQNIQTRYPTTGYTSTMMHVSP